MMRYRLAHETVYEYADAVSVSHNVAHLLPRVLARQTPIDCRLAIDPTPTTVSPFTDSFGNPCVFFIVEEPHHRLAVRATGDVEVEATPERPLEPTAPWDAVAAHVRSSRDAVSLDAYEYVFDSPLVTRSCDLAAYAAPSFPAGRPLLAGTLDLCHRIHAEFTYDPEATTLATPIEAVLAERHGVCQDFAQVMIGALRSLGLPARYVSGYLRSRPPAGTGAAADTKLLGAEASHAWVSVFSLEHGWVDFDPTNDVVPSDRHVTLGWGRDYDDVSPIDGVTLGGGLQTVAVAVDLRPPEEFERLAAERRRKA
jgi:transglutaminase-like putative cysteine protease